MTEFYLIGRSLFKLKFNELNNKNVLRYYFTYFSLLDSDNKKVYTKEKCIKKIIIDLINIYDKKSIQTSSFSSIKRKFTNLLEEYSKIKRNKRKDYESKKLKLFKIKLFKEFDIKFKGKRNLINKSSNKTLITRLPSKRATYKLINDDQFSNDYQFSNDDQFSNDEMVNDPEYLPPFEKKRKIDIITPELCDSLDRDMVTDRTAFSTICNTLKSDGVNINNVIISHSTINKKRINNRIKNYNDLKFFLSQQNYIILHFDNIGIKDKMTNEIFDNTVIKVTGDKFEKLIGIVKCEDSKALTIFNAIIYKLKEFSLERKIFSLSYDNCPTNTGNNGGVVKLLLNEFKTNFRIDHDIIKLPCRFHVFEIQLKKVFFHLFPGTDGPNVGMFVQLQKEFKNINLNKIQNYKGNLFNDTELNLIKNFVNKQLTLNFDRSDFHELLELICIFLNFKNFKIKYPGAFHHARWLSKLLYCFKIYFFYDQLIEINYFKKLEKSGKISFKKIELICIYCIKVHMFAWFEAEIPQYAPLNDLSFINNVSNLPNSNFKDIKKIILDSFLNNYLTYLDSSHIFLSFFDDRIEINLKEKMLKNLKKKEKNIVIKKNCKIEELINCNVKKNLEMLKISLNLNFLEKNVKDWSNDQSYIDTFKKIKNFRVTNVAAERGCKDTKDYSNRLSKNTELVVITAEKNRQKLCKTNKTSYI